MYPQITDITDHPIFTGVSENYIKKLFLPNNFEIKNFQKNEIAFSSKRATPAVAFILKGSAKVFSGCESDGALIKTLVKGEIFGIANLYSQCETFPSTIVAADDLTIMFVTAESFKAFIEGDITVLRNYLSFQSKKIVYLNKKIATYTAGTAEKKLLMYMTENAECGVFNSNCSMIELSDMLGIGRASLYRAIDGLEEEGFIEKVSKNKYLIK